MLRPHRPTGHQFGLLTFTAAGCRWLRRLRRLRGWDFGALGGRVFQAARSGGGATGAGGVKHARAGENEWSGEGSFEGSPPGSQDVVDLLLQLAAPAALLLQLLSQRLGVVLLLQFPQLLL